MSKINENLPTEMAENLPTEIEEKFTETLDENLPEIMEQNLPKILEEIFPKTIGENLPETLKENLPKTLVENLPEPLIEPKSGLTLIPIESFNETNSCSIDKDKESHNIDPQIERLVIQSLEEFQTITQSDATDANKDAIMSFIIPKVMSQVQSSTDLAERLQTMRTELESCKQHMCEMGQDLGDIFMDLHSIYKKLESKDKKNTILSKTDRDRLARFAQEAEVLKESNKHFLSNDPRELSAMFKAPQVEPK